MDSKTLKVDFILIDGEEGKNLEGENAHSYTRGQCGVENVSGCWTWPDSNTWHLFWLLFALFLFMFFIIFLGGVLYIFLSVVPFVPRDFLYIFLSLYQSLFISSSISLDLCISYLSLSLSIHKHTFKYILYSSIFVYVSPLFVYVSLVLLRLS